MRALVLLATGIAATFAAATPASAACIVETSRTLRTAYVGVCQERNWEYQQVFLNCAVDTDGDGTADLVCHIPLIEYMG